MFGRALIAAFDAQNGQVIVQNPLQSLYRYYKGIYMTSFKYRMGVDGGGTSCRVALETSAIGTRFERLGGPANVSDFEGALSRIIDLLEGLLVEAGVGRAGYADVSAHLGLAGVTGPVMAGRVRAAIAAALPFGRITVTGDNVTMIAGALGARDGAVAAIGTGSFVGVKRQGQVKTLGGRGFLLGDQASGGWLGKRLLEELMLACDGLRAHSDLSRAALARYGSVAEVIAFAVAARPADIATLAPDVIAAAKVGDLLAKSLMEEGARYINAALHALNWRVGDVLCLTGGLGPAYANLLPVEARACLAAPMGSALDGALGLAAEGGPA